MIEFLVPTIPIAQPRPRATALAGRVRVFEAKQAHPVHVYKAAVTQAARAAYAGAPLDGPLRVTLYCVFPRPASMRWKTRPQVRVWHGKKPDCDNVAKSTLDSLNGLLYRDDSQVASLMVLKVIASGDEQPHVVVTIEEATALATPRGPGEPQ